MNKRCGNFLLTAVIVLLIISMTPMTIFANAAEPPALVILVNDPPEDLSIVLVSEPSQTEASVRKVAWEGYYAFYSRDMQTDSEYVFKITAGQDHFEWSPEKALKGYNNVFTLDVSKQTITPGKYPFRAAFLVSIRLVITLLIEGFIFVLFGFKEKRSWITFFVVNMITQGALNIWLNVEGTLMPSYLLITLAIGEVVVFAVELVAFPLLLKEHKNSRVFIYVFIANLVSLTAGGYLISFLPV